jgi:hypothetical protein
MTEPFDQHATADEATRERPLTASDGATRPPTAEPARLELLAEIARGGMGGVRVHSGPALSDAWPSGVGESVTALHVF